MTQQGPYSRRGQSLIQNEDWGDPREYSLTVTRTGEGLDTKFEVDASPHKPTPEPILKEYKENKIDLEALFEGKSPFEATERSEDIDPKEFRPKVAQASAADKLSPEDEASVLAGTGKDDLPF